MSELKCNYLLTLASYDVYLPTKTLFMFGEINIGNAEKWIKGLHCLDSYTGQITIKLNSEGGEVTHARALYDAIKGCKNVVHIIVLGEANSSASLILQAGDVRIMTPNSQVMIHIGSPSNYGDHPESRQNWTIHEKQIEKWMEDVYLLRIKQKRPRFTRKQLKKLLLFDTIMLPILMLSLGLVDEVRDDPQ